MVRAKIIQYNKSNSTILVHFYEFSESVRWTERIIIDDNTMLESIANHNTKSLIPPLTITNIETCNHINQDFVCCIIDQLITMKTNNINFESTGTPLNTQILNVINDEWTAAELYKLWISNPMDDHLKYGSYFCLRTTLDSIGNELFYGKQRMTMTCSNDSCQHQSISIGSYNCIKLPIPIDSESDIVPVIVDIHQYRTLYYCNKYRALSHLAETISKEYGLNSGDIAFGQKSNGIITEIYDHKMLLIEHKQKNVTTTTAAEIKLCIFEQKFD